MNRTEAQYLLRAYRAGGQDANDPQFREALAAVRQDPELGRWLAEEQAIDRRLAAKLAALPAPPGLKAQLSAARSLIRPQPWWRQPIWLATAAAAILILAVGALMVSRSDHSTLAQFRTAMVRASLNTNHHVQVLGLDLPDARRWLAVHGGSGEVILPTGLRDYTPKGCQVLRWRGCEVSLLCFRLKMAGHVDVFVINAKALPARVSAQPVFAVRNRLTTVVWRYGGQVYLLAGKASQADLERLL